MGWFSRFLENSQSGSAERRIGKVAIIVENDVLAEADGQAVVIPETLIPAADSAMADADFINRSALVDFVGLNAIQQMIVGRLEDGEIDGICLEYSRGAPWQNFRAETDLSRYSVVVVLDDLNAHEEEIVDRLTPVSFEVRQEHCQTDFASGNPRPTPGPGGSELDQSVPYWNSGEYSKAREHMENAIGLGLEGSDQAVAFQILGQIALKERDLGRGVEFLLSALAEPQRTAETACVCASHLEPVLEGLGDRESAQLMRELREATQIPMRLDSTVSGQLRHLAAAARR